ncbi:MAG: site-specific integrase [Myxococcales bacterium]
MDIVVHLPDGKTLRERRKAPVTSKSGAQRWAEARERILLSEALAPRKRKDVPTLAVFWPRFLEGHCKANRHKPSGVDSKESAYRNYLGPLLGDKRLDAISNEDIARLKSHMAEKQPATTNNVLSALNMALKVALEWSVIDNVPCKIRLLRKQKPTPRFYDFDQYAWLIEAAGKIDARIEILALLGGDAGLRRGEIIALDWGNVDLRRNRLVIDRAEWKGKVTETKGMEMRVVPMTDRLHAALSVHRHLRGDRVLYTDSGETVTAKVLQKWIARAQKRAGLRATGALHILRHTFCSHLAMRGAAALSIQKLAGHKNLQTTLRYMHLAEGEADRAIRLLNAPVNTGARGDILETTQPSIAMINGSA